MDSVREGFDGTRIALIALAPLLPRLEHVPALEDVTACAPSDSLRNSGWAGVSGVFPLSGTISTTNRRAPPPSTAALRVPFNYMPVAPGAKPLAQIAPIGE